MNDPVTTPPPAPPTPAPERSFRWVPIRSLAPRHRGRILRHLLALEPHDRYLRFGYAANDAQIGRYVDLLDFERDEVFGIFNRHLQLMAMAHLAYLPDAPGEVPMTEFGVSVHPGARGRGYGARLFDHAVLHSQNRHIHTMIIHALTENAAMLRIARNAGATVVREGSESEARLKLPGESVGSHFEELIEDRAAVLNYGLKNGARHVDALLELISEVKASLGRVRRSTIE